MRRRPAASAAVSLLLLGALAACGSDAGPETEGTGSSETAATTSGIDGLTVTGDFGKEAEVTVDGLDVDTATSAVLIKGEGDEVADDDRASYFFRIVNGSTGDSVADNYTSGQVEKLDVATQPDEVKEAVVGQPYGSRVALAMPVTDLVGAEGAPQVGLEPDQDVVLVFDLVEAAADPLPGPEGDAVDPPAGAPTVVEDGDQVTGVDFADAPKSPPATLQVIPLIEGTGATVKATDTLTVDYFGVVWRGKQPFDESYTRGEPATFGLDQVIEGWTKGLPGVTVGSRVMLVIPPGQAYGDQDQPNIPAGSTLVFVIDVLGANL